MRSNIVILAVFVLISSTWAAPLTNRPVARVLRRRSAQAVLSRSSSDGCHSDDAYGSSWIEEGCSKMPGVTGFRDVITGKCRTPSDAGTGKGTCYIKKRSISRVYRRMIAEKGIPKVTNPADEATKLSPSPASQDNPTEPPSPAKPSSATSAKTASSTTSPNSTASPPTVTAPTSTSSDDATLTEDPKTVPTPEGPTPQHGPNPDPSPPIVGIPGGGPAQTDEDAALQDPSPSAEKDVSASPSTSAEVPSATENAASPISPIQAPFAAPKPMASASFVANEAVEGSSGSPTSTSRSSEPTSASHVATIPVANVPISHGTEVTWGGTLVNTINGMHSPKAGLRKTLNQKPMKLKTVVGTLFFDLVYGRFLF